MRSARGAAVSAQRTILYNVSYGGDKGPIRNAWWTISADGSNAAKLELWDDFTPRGLAGNQPPINFWSLSRNKGPLESASGCLVLGSKESK